MDNLLDNSLMLSSRGYYGYDNEELPQSLDGSQINTSSSDILANTVPILNTANKIIAEGEPDPHSESEVHATLRRYRHVILDLTSHLTDLIEYTDELKNEIRKKDVELNREHDIWLKEQPDHTLTKIPTPQKVDREAETDFYNFLINKYYDPDSKEYADVNKKRKALGISTKSACNLLHDTSKCKAYLGDNNCSNIPSTNWGKDLLNKYGCPMSKPNTSDDVSAALNKYISGYVNP